jgi:hypothetical protein
MAQKKAVLIYFVAEAWNHAEKLRLSTCKNVIYIHLVKVKNVFHYSINGTNVQRFVKTGFKVTAVNNLTPITPMKYSLTLITFLYCLSDTDIFKESLSDK